MGGPNQAFQTTHWSQIVRARTEDLGRRREVLGEILGRYWRPVYSYLRRKGYGDEDAKDLVQGFFQGIVLGRDLVQHADQEKGRFRTFLLTALDRYAVSVRRAATARKRVPEAPLVSLDAMASSPACEPAASATPEESFNYAWASALLDQVLGEVELECRKGGQAAHWAVFRARVVAPILEGEAAPSLWALCAEHRIPDEAKASNMVITVKRRFQATLRRHVRQAVGSDAEVEQEILDLMEILSRSGAGS